MLSCNLVIGLAKAEIYRDLTKATSSPKSLSCPAGSQLNQTKSVLVSNAARPAVTSLRNRT